MTDQLIKWLTLAMSSFSFIWAINSWRKDKKKNQAKNEFDLAKQIFEQTLVIDIPRAYDTWYSAQDRSSQTEFYDLISGLRKRSLYFQYRYKNFYDETLKILRATENEIGLANNSSLDSQQRKEHENNIDEYLEKIYTQFFKKLLKEMEKK